MEHVLKCTKHITSLYSSRGFNVGTVLMDGEFAPTCHDLHEMGISLNLVAANKHVPKIKHQI